MSLLQSLILGILQGLTEFLPISSSAHLVIFPYLLGWQIPAELNFAFDVLVQLGTLVAVIFYFRSDIAAIFKGFGSDLHAKKLGSTAESRLGWYVVLATIPAGAVGLLIKDIVEQAFGKPSAVAFFLFATAFLLTVAEKVGKQSRDLTSMHWLDALWVGLFQVFSLFPGISRSGACIAGGMTRNFERRSAGHFAFLMSIPIMAAAGLLSMLDLFAISNLSQFLPVLLIGFVTAGVVGYFAIGWMLDFVHSHSLFIFAGYCFFLGAAVLAFGYFFPQASNPDISQNSTSQAIVLPARVTITPALSWLAPHITTCMEKTLKEKLPLLVSSAEFQPEELRFTFPFAGISDLHAYQIGTQTLQLCLNPANPLRSLNKDDLSTLLRGDFTTWEEFFLTCTSCTFAEVGNMTFDAPFQFYLYAQESPYLTVLEQALGMSSAEYTGALFIPDAETLLATLQLERGSAGFLPTQWIPQGFTTVNITDLPVTALELPVLAVFSSEPRGAVKELILCVQSNI